MTNYQFTKLQKIATEPSIRTKLAKLVIGCVLPLGSVAAFLIFNFYEQEQVLLTKNAISQARLMVATVDRMFFATQASLLALGTSRRLVGGDLNVKTRLVIDAFNE